MSGKSGEKNGRLAVLSVAALGIVYGDIGTSPLYALRESLSPAEHGLELTRGNVLGVLSLIVWSLLLLVAVKYVVVMLRADNEGEGGILALTTLVNRSLAPDHPRRKVALVLGLFGAALLYGDGLITPAISVLSAVEGLKVRSPGLAPAVIPIAVVILVVLFSIQRKGTGKIGAFFGPVMLLWFATLGVLGVKEILRAPEVLVALDPTHAVRFFATDGLKGFLVLGSVVLVVTGGEAIYADMGHFGARPIRVAWFGLVLPALLLNYFGQGALLLRSPQALDNPLFEMVPPWGVLPMVVLATAATTIASQALISGVFSLTRQAVQLRFLPRLMVLHTSETERGQIYLPAVNWALLAGCIFFVVDFGSSQPAGRGLRRRGHVDDAPDDAPPVGAARRRLEGRAVEGGAPRRDLPRRRARVLRRESREARARRVDSARARRGRLHAAGDVEAGTADRPGTAAEPGRQPRRAGRGVRPTGRNRGSPARSPARPSSSCAFPTSFRRRFS